MDTPAFDPARLVRSASLSLALYLSIIAIVSMTLVKPAHADGQVDSINVYTINSGGFTNGCIGKASVAEAMQCDVDFENSFLDANYAQIASWGGYDIAICPRAVAHDLNMSNPYLYFFKVSPIYTLFAYMPPNPKIAVCTGGGETYASINVIPSSCPSNTNAGFPCTCNTGYVPDSTATSCVPVSTCPILPLTTPPFNDACAEVLENINSTQAQKDAACGVLTDNLKTGMACFSDKLSRTNDIFTGNPIPLKITSDIRDIAYQAHFREIWDKMEELVRLMKNDPAMQTACATRRAEIAAEKGCDKAGPCKSKKDEVCYAESATQRSHCLIGRPANPNPDDAQHTSGNAFDVSRTYTINPLQAALGALRPPETIPQFLDAPPTNCNLNWGGTFTDNYDPIHFYVR